MKRQYYKITGMNCSACSARVEHVVAQLKGIYSVQVNLLTGRMTVDLDPKILRDNDVCQAVESAGYGARPISPHETVSIRKETEPIKRRFLFSLLFLTPLVVLHHTVADSTGNLLQILLMLPILWLNRAFFLKGSKALLHGAPNMDTLVALGAGAAAAYSLLSFLEPGTEAHIYAESAGMILTLITLGKWLEARATGRSSEALEKLMTLLPENATLLQNEKILTVPAAAVRAGEIVLVRPGDRIPVDGEVLSGVSSVNEAALTGESLPAEKEPGSSVYAGSVNLHGILRIRAAAPREQSALSRVIRLVGEAAASKAPIAKIADRISGIFVPAVVAVALITTGIWIIAGEDAAFAAGCAIAVLVISCPCALGLATPVAIMAATAKGAENGILFRSGEALEAAGTIDTVILDKTGTITSGHPIVTDILPIGSNREHLVWLAASLEAHGNHPLAEAVQQATQGVVTTPMEDYRYIPGRGIRCRIEGRPAAAGNAQLMQECGIDISDTPAKQWAAAGKTPLYFADRGILVGMMAVADPVKESSRSAIADMKRAGLQLIMMTGDNAATAKAIANEIGIDDIDAEVLPQDKDKRVQQLRKEGRHVAMVGDGINDAPALTRADVGIAIGAGTDIAMESAGVILARSNLKDAVNALRLSKATLTTIKQNLFWAFAYNVLAIPLAAGAFYPWMGWKLSPGIAAAAMSLSSLFVVTNALRLKRLPLIQDNSDNTAPPMNTITISVEGMMCPHCEALVRETLLSIPGVRRAVPDHKKKQVTVAAENTVTEQTLRDAISRAGYTPR